MRVSLPQWAQKLLDKHPGAKRPSVEDPMPTWLEEELKKMPLWAYIRGTDDVRRGHKGHSKHWKHGDRDEVCSHPDGCDHAAAIGDY